MSRIDRSLSVWAVRDGDVAAVPEPPALALLAAGLAVVAGRAARRRRPRPDALDRTVTDLSLAGE